MRDIDELMKEMDSKIKNLQSKIGKSGGRNTKNNLCALLGSAMIIAADKTLSDDKRLAINGRISLAKETINVWLRVNP